MMTDDKVQEAAEWLEQLFDDLTKEPAYEKSGEELMLRVQWEIERLAPDLQRAVVDALLKTGSSAPAASALTINNITIIRFFITKSPIMTCMLTCIIHLVSRFFGGVLYDQV